MKKFYETPMVEFTVFDVEDVITTSVASIPTAGMSEEQINTLFADIKDDAATAGTDFLGNYKSSSYNW